MTRTNARKEVMEVREMTGFQLFIGLNEIKAC